MPAKEANELVMKSSLGDTNDGIDMVRQRFMVKFGFASPLSSQVSQDLQQQLLPVIWNKVSPGLSPFLPASFNSWGVAASAGSSFHLRNGSWQRRERICRCKETATLRNRKSWMIIFNISATQAYKQQNGSFHTKQFTSLILGEGDCGEALVSRRFLTRLLG